MTVESLDARSLIDGVRDKDVVLLAEMVSLALKVDARLLRAARYRFVAWRGPDLEADLWHSPLVASAGASGLLLRPDVCAELRSRLAADRDRCLLARELIAEQHSWLPDTARFEEQLAYLALLPGGEVVTRQRLAELDSVVRQNEGLAPWATGVRVRLSRYGPNRGDDRPLRARPSRRLRVWVDLTNSPHVLVMRPVIEQLRDDGHNVDVTARDFAQTLGLCERFGIEHTAIGRHRGGGLAAKARGLGDRSLALLRWARGRRFDLALGHGSNDVTVAAALLRIPCSTTFDYEWATVQHSINCRLAQAVVVPDAIPPERLYRFGARSKIRSYEGLKEEYYLWDFEPDPAVLAELGLDRASPIAVVRTPPAVSLYHRFEHDLFGDVLNRLRGSQAVVLPLTEAQRVELARAGGFIVPEQAIDAQSLIAYADLVISAGGTMNREAVALGTPVYTVFEGRLGAVDERLIADGRLRRLERAEDVVLEKGDQAATHVRVRRDPALLADLLLLPALA
jgi:predicted glycosyltransferase